MQSESAQVDSKTLAMIHQLLKCMHFPLDLHKSTVILQNVWMQQHKFSDQIGLLNTMWSCLPDLHPPFAYRFPSSYRCSSRDTWYSWARRVSTIKMWSFRKRLSELCLAAWKPDPGEWNQARTYYKTCKGIRPRSLQLPCDQCLWLCNIKPCNTEAK